MSADRAGGPRSPSGARRRVVDSSRDRHGAFISAHHHRPVGSESLSWLVAALGSVVGLAVLYREHVKPPACARCAEPLAEARTTTIARSPLVVETLYRCPRCGAASAQRIVGVWD